jgi:hypothetical protein
MTFNKPTLAGCLVLSIVIGVEAFLARGVRAQKPPETAPLRRSLYPEREPKLIDPLLQKLLNSAERRAETQLAAYEEGRITIDRILDASLQLAEAELRTARTAYERMAIKKRHFDRLKRIEEREEVEVKEGRGTKADVVEATMRCVEAEMDLRDAITVRSTPDTSRILRRLNELERKVAQLQKDRPPSGHP